MSRALSRDTMYKNIDITAKMAHISLKYRVELRKKILPSPLTQSIIPFEFIPEERFIHSIIIFMEN